MMTLTLSSRTCLALQALRYSKFLIALTCRQDDAMHEVIVQYLKSNRKKYKKKPTRREFGMLILYPLLSVP